MGGAEWNGAVALLKAWLVHQPAPIPIAILLAAAFSLVMFIEGLRVNFIPARKTGRPASKPPPETVELKTSNFMKQSAIAGSSPRMRPKPQPASRRIYGAPRPAVCHRIKLEMVNLAPVEQPEALADQS
jgi:hypothetical protein